MAEWWYPTINGLSQASRGDAVPANPGTMKIEHKFFLKEWMYL